MNRDKGLLFVELRDLRKRMKAIKRLIDYGFRVSYYGLRYYESSAIESSRKFWLFHVMDPERFYWIFKFYFTIFWLVFYCLIMQRGALIFTWFVFSWMLWKQFRNLFSTTATTSIASAFSKQRSSHYGAVRLLTQVIHLGEDANWCSFCAL